MTFRFLALTACLGLTLTACDSADDFSIGGEYTGDTRAFSEVTFGIPDTDSGDTFQFSVLLVDRETGTESTLGGTGTYDHPRITLTLTPGGDVFSGTVSDDGDEIQVGVGNEIPSTYTRR